MQCKVITDVVTSGKSAKRRDRTQSITPKSPSRIADAMGSSIALHVSSHLTSGRTSQPTSA
jgi:hypothetical protein